MGPGLYGKFSFWHAPLVRNTSNTRLGENPAVTVSRVTGHDTERIFPGLLDHHSTTFAILDRKLLAERQQLGGFKNAIMSYHTCHQAFPSKVSCEDWSGSHFVKCSDPGGCPQGSRTTRESRHHQTDKIKQNKLRGDYEATLKGETTCFKEAQ